MKIIIAPNSYKGSLSSLEVAKYIHQGFCSPFLEAQFVFCPMADGGEGTVQCILQTVKGQWIKTIVSDPLKQQREAHYGILSNSKTAIIEMASASGLSLVPFDKRNPLKTASTGTGELILHALNQGIRKFIIGLGGSATVDMGMGALCALGIQFKDKQGKSLEPCGEALMHIMQIDSTGLDKRLYESEFIIAHDVDNPLLGEKGALMYAPQKGATKTEMKVLKKGLNHFLALLEPYRTGMQHLPGSGAGGGLGIGLATFLNAKFQKGAELVMELCQYPKQFENAALIITGEGQIDGQTLQGKAPIALAKWAKQWNIPVIAIVARIGEGYEQVYSEGIHAVFSIASGPLTKRDSFLQTKLLLIQTSNNIARVLKLGVNR